MLVCSETFSFVLTEVDGSRKNGYCRRLLVSMFMMLEVYGVFSNNNNNTFNLEAPFKTPKVSLQSI